MTEIEGIIEAVSKEGEFGAGAGHVRVKLHSSSEDYLASIGFVTQGLRQGNRVRLEFSENKYGQLTVSTVTLLEKGGLEAAEKSTLPQDESPVEPESKLVSPQLADQTSYPEDFIERFWSKVDKSGKCWLWTGAITGTGYGSIQAPHHGGSLVAHRVAYQLQVGPIPAGMLVLHRCDNPLCVTPSHLFLGTDLDNVADMDAKGRRATKLDRNLVAEIREKYAGGGVTQQQLADQYNVSFQHMNEIINDKAWKQPRINSPTTPSKLRIQLDEIDKRVVGEVFGGFFESRLKIELGIWEKGKVLCGYRGVNPNATARELAAATGRHYEDLKRWVELYERYPDRDKFLEEYAKPKAETWTKKALTWKDKYLPVESPALPNGQFTVIYADPPWQYEHPISESRAIESHYPTMPLEQIKSLKIPSAESSVLFLWSPAPKLSEALEVMASWGFNYRTNAAWDKQTIGMGYWFRQQHELLLVGTKGEVTPPAPESRISSVIRSPREEHSRKPLIVYELIEQMLPGQQYIELFGRGKARKGWESWGLDAA